MSKINIYVNSKNRKSDESPSNFSVIIPDDLLKIKKDEYFTLSVNSFYCYNDFYHCNENSNGSISRHKERRGGFGTSSRLVSHGVESNPPDNWTGSTIGQARQLEKRYCLAFKNLGAKVMISTTTSQ